MTRTLSTPRITVGRHYHRATIWRLARLLIHKWHIFQRAAHNRKVHPTVQQALKELLQGPLFQICRQLREELQRPLSLNTETIRRMFEFLSRSENVVLIPQAFLATATEWVEQTQGLRGFAKLENDYEQRRGLNDGVLMLKAHMWGYLSCGILAEMPATAMSFTPKQESLQRLAAVLPDRYTVLGNAAMAEHFEPGTRLQLAETRGFAMFRSVRAQLSGQAECGASGLVRWLAEPQPRRRRALYCDIAAGIHELACVGLNLRRSMLAAPPGSELQRLRLNGLLVAEITYSDLFETRFFMDAA